MNSAGTLRVEEGTTGNGPTTRSFLSHLRSLTNFFHDENLPHQRSSTSYFSLQPISFSLIQIFEYLGEQVSSPLSPLFLVIALDFSSILHPVGSDRRE